MQALADTVTYLRRVDSTNNYAMARLHAGLAKHGDTVFAYEQTAGRGQRGKKWQAKPGENLLLSIVVEPHMLISQQFQLSAAVALACHQLFRTYCDEGIRIKWPNDIYWSDRKAGGILIENVIRNDQWLFAVVGIGLNLNQVEFQVDGVRPVSLKQLTGKNYEPAKIARQLAAILEMEIALNSNVESTMMRYNEVLYKKECMVWLKRDNITFQTMIKGVNQWGELLTFSGVEQRYRVGEVEWCPTQ